MIKAIAFDYFGVIKINNDNGYCLNKDIVSLIKKLKDKNFKIALVSNNPVGLKTELVKEGIYDLFETVIFSGEVGYQKPEPEIFNVLFSKLGLEPNEVIFIDDTLRCLEGADNIGYIPLLFTNNNKLKSDLSNMLNLVF